MGLRMVLNEPIFSEFVVFSKPRELVALVWSCPKMKDLFHNKNK